MAVTLRTVALAALLASCGAVTPSTPSPTQGGTAVVAWQEPASLDLLYVPGVQAAATIARVAVEGLVKLDPEGREVPALAREVPTLANGGVTVGADARTMTVRYRLREGVRWSDGEAFTSADVRFTWRAIMTDSKVASREGYDRIDDVETIDDLTAVVRYRALDPAYLTRFDVILPRHLLDNATPAVRASYGRMPLGTGPFRIVEFAAGDHVTAERNPQARVRPNLERIVFRFTPSLDVAKAQLRAGEADLAPSIFESDVPDLASDGAIAIAQAASPVVETVIFNLAKPSDDGADPGLPHPVLSDRAVRRALVLATPKQRIVDSLLFGRARAGTSEIPLGWAATGVTQDAYDPAAARRELDAAGWTPGADGIRSRRGVRASLRLTGTTGNALRERIEQVLIDEWRAVGVEAKIANVASSVLTAPWSGGGVRKRGSFDMVIANAGLGTAGADPVGYLTQRYRCASIPTAANGGAGANYGRWCDPAADAALAEAVATLDRDTQ
ncbi:MAG TPA: peptide ABC transporter substrate-binding protein, partial [Candidatus Limnocylindria bacterium]|nr:peptide ABC transporter substrate-binding protein [Candidatus Limnocylindria bacterium]